MEILPFLPPTLLLLLLLHSAPQIPAQTAGAAPSNVTAVLAKAGQFNTLIRLMKTTQIADQIDGQLNNSNAGITLFAPTDNAFSALPPGTLNSLTDQQKVSLIQFHIIPSFITLPQFQTVSNPLRTQAGSADNGQFPLNVTSSGNQVNISTGVVNTTVSNALYSDGKLAVYQVDKVLLPLQIFGAAAPAPGPAEPSKSKKKSGDAGGAPAGGPSKEAQDASLGFRLNWMRSGEWVVFVGIGSFFWL